MARLHLLPFILTALIYLLLECCGTLPDSSESRIGESSRAAQLVTADSVSVTADARWLVVHVPDDYTLKPGRWVFPMPSFSGVDSTLIVDRKALSQVRLH